MKKILTLIILALMVLPGYSQELSRKEKRKMEKQIKKEKKAEELAESAAVVEAMVTQHLFVLEATQLRDKRGNMINVSSTINFVAVDSINGVVQIGSNSYVGRNGVGGITLEGTVANYEYSKHEKSDSYNITYYLRTPVGSYDVRVVAYPDGRAEATVNSSLWGGRITYSGQLVPPGLSRVYKGSSL